MKSHTMAGEQPLREFIERVNMRKNLLYVHPMVIYTTKWDTNQFGCEVKIVLIAKKYGASFALTNMERLLLFLDAHAQKYDEVARRRYK